MEILFYVIVFIAGLFFADFQWRRVKNLVSKMVVCELKPGDVLVLEIPGRVGSSELEYLKHQFNQLGIEPNKVLLLVNGSHIKIVRQDEVE